jgi:hypothetical protein
MIRTKVSKNFLRKVLTYKVISTNKTSLNIQKWQPKKITKVNLSIKITNLNLRLKIRIRKRRLLKSLNENYIRK